MNLKDRYDKEHKHGDITFYLPNYRPEPEQCRFLMLKVLEQAVRDYCALVDSELPNERLLWKMARDFIYDDEYLIQWGEWELNITEFLNILDIDVDWAREQCTKKFLDKQSNKARQENRHGDKYAKIKRPAKEPSSTSGST